MKILHTSDWHLGHTLYGRKRYGEHAAFLKWLSELIQEKEADALLVAGDIFDTATPGLNAQELYYRFLDAIRPFCRTVVIIGGNHDSPSFLDAPRPLLRALHVYVIGRAAADPAGEVVPLLNRDGQVGALVCAVPYLHDRDVRAAAAGESTEEKDQKLVDGICSHYAAVAEKAQQRAASYGKTLPIIGMGHLFAGGNVLPGDGVRELYVGSLGQVPVERLPQFHYFALGHLHVPQAVSGRQTVRYSGSPIPIGFGEASQQKSVCLVSFPEEGDTGNALEPDIQLVPVPLFQKLKQIRGDMAAITRQMAALRLENEPYWLDVIYDGSDAVGGLRQQIEDCAAASRLEVLRIQNNRVQAALDVVKEGEVLEELDDMDVFKRCLNAHHVPECQHKMLFTLYKEVAQAVCAEERDGGAVPDSVKQGNDADSADTL